jgi:hypothetical protein
MNDTSEPIARPSNERSDHERWLAETWQMIEECAKQTDERHRVSLSPRGCAALLAERAACAPWLKDSETPAERLESNHRECLALLGLLAAEKRKVEAYEELLGQRVDQLKGDAPETPDAPPGECRRQNVPGDPCDRNCNWPECGCVPDSQGMMHAPKGSEILTEPVCAICGEHANEHLAIPHQFMPGGRATAAKAGEQPHKNPADFPGGPLEYPEDFDDTSY